MSPQSHETSNKLLGPLLISEAVQCARWYSCSRPRLAKLQTEDPCFLVIGSAYLIPNLRAPWAVRAFLYYIHDLICCLGSDGGAAHFPRPPRHTLYGDNFVRDDGPDIRGDPASSDFRALPLAHRRILVGIRVGARSRLVPCGAFRVREQAAARSRQEGARNPATISQKHVEHADIMQPDFPKALRASSACGLGVFLCAVKRSPRLTLDAARARARALVQAWPIAKLLDYFLGDDHPTGAYGWARAGFLPSPCFHLPVRTRLVSSNACGCSLLAHVQGRACIRACRHLRMSTCRNVAAGLEFLISSCARCRFGGNMIAEPSASDEPLLRCTSLCLFSRAAHTRTYASVDVSPMMRPSVGSLSARRAQGVDQTSPANERRSRHALARRGEGLGFRVQAL